MRQLKVTTDIYIDMKENETEDAAGDRLMELLDTIEPRLEVNEFSNSEIVEEENE